ncbi:5-demethoxyubiquinol-8 5-hydroxylase UbiM [Xanthomonas sacchari]|uniref:5-demethoxyubiquinol-8 5-hydroxylase UbiM n=1 Tax=Xanthomonas sacchari TaxID=56458 RepID=UPI002256D493|nr:5-demethoxyubiquinol-8 5-hydroxylase UbiM [Xanthomonas sacchari]UYK83365.1 5-demethoxyubiquinol-8 5-hydroxylase UbiM [Xanthomonas sacchari]
MQVDIAIVGAGPAGLCFARSLAGSGLSLALIEPQPRAALAEAAFDGREIALSHASRALLDQLDLWPRIDPQAIAPLRDARVMNGSSPFALTFAAGEGGRGDLGWLVPNHLIRRAAFAAVQDQPGLTLLDGVSVQALRRDARQAQLQLSDGRSVAARLVVAADSRFSSTRRMSGIGAQLRDFGRTMLVCRVRHERPHHQTAWEWFGYGRTMALLPLHGNEASAVLTLPPERAQALLQMDEAALGAEISTCFEHRLGAMTPLVRPQAYPLVAVYAQRFVAERYALIGDAAVGMHPVTAHGFNFGLQSQARLARALHDAVARGGDIAAPALLAGYQRGHRLATRPLYEATNAIAALYTDDRLSARALRSAALRVADRVAPFKRAIAAHLTQRVAAMAR